MILKNLMEDKQLDLNQPFISVRRLPSSESEEKMKTENSLPKTRSLPVYKSELKSGPIRIPGTVPFLWEQTPGRPKDEGKSQARAPQQPPVAPKLPPGRSLNVRTQSLDKDSEGAAITRIGDVLSRSLNAPSFNEYLMKHDISKQENEDKPSLDSDDDDSEAYMDARDTLSRTESSSFLNCSLSGLSGSVGGLSAKPFGSFSDQQTRDFMMGRFLPAAKAMASESPHYTTWKQPAAREQPRQVSMTASVDKRQTLYQHRPTDVQPCIQSREAQEGEEDSDDEPEYSSAKGCGLLPQLCLLNPVPGLRIKGCVSISSVPRAQAKSSYACFPSKNEKRQQKTKLKIESKAISIESNGQKLDGTSLYRRLHGNGISSNGFNGDNQRGKGRKNLREILASHSTEWELGEASPVVEKTLYIDCIHVLNSMDSNPSCSDSKGNDFEVLEKEETHSIDSCLQDIKHLDVVNEKATPQPKCLESVDSSHDVKVDKTDALIRRDQNLIQSSMTSTTSKETENAENDSGDEHLAKPSNSDISCGSSHLHLPPPLPKKPSESWLSRTLPAVSSRKQSSLGMQSYNRTQACKTPSLDPKWENIVKTTNVHHGHLRFSEELLTPIPET